MTAPTPAAVLSGEQRASWSDNGFFRIPHFAPAETCRAMLDRVIDLARHPDDAKAIGAEVRGESNKSGQPRAHPEDGVSKIFKLHRHDPFASFATSPAVTDLVAELIARGAKTKLQELRLEIYRRGAEHALQKGIIIADTKFEFGLVDDELIWIDEALTPDSSRFWPADGYQPGRAQPSYDKQYVRDYLERIGWNKQPPGPELPPDVVAATREKYREAYRQLTGNELG